MFTSVELADRIEATCVLRGMKVSHMLAASSLDKSTINSMKKGSMPSTDKIDAIASTLVVSVDYLLGRTDDPAPVDAKDSDDVKWGDFKYALYSETEEMTNEQQQSVLDFVRFVKAQGKQKKND